MNQPLALALAAVLCAPGAPAIQDGAAAEPTAALVWNRRNAEHLLNRAGFGARESEVARALALGPVALVDELLAGPATPREPFFAERLSNKDGGGMAMEAQLERMGTPVEGMELDALRAELRRRDQLQLFDCTREWVEHMVAGDDPLRDRLTLFWHGHFTSSMADVKSSYKLIVQQRFLFDHALGRFGELLRGIARDPAMLEYLDNRSNRKEHPNENFARELLELFALGAGNYGEQDVQEIARAFTGWTERDGDFVALDKQHDRGMKQVLGRSGRFDGNAVIDILLAHAACPRWIAGRLLAYFEGVEPDEARLAEYAAELRASDYDVAAFMRKLLLDPRFYRDEVVGARVASPLDWLVGSARRLGVSGAEPLILAGAQLLGEQLFHPPNVSGWEGGLAWITTSSTIQRGNLGGVLVGVLDFDDTLSAPEVELAPEPGMASMESVEGHVDPDAESTMAPALDGGAPEVPKVRAPLARGMARYLREAWRARLNLSARLADVLDEGDERVADALLAEVLATEPTAEARAVLLATLREKRAAFGLLEGELAGARDDAERLLRELAHVALALPEAQLH